MSNAVKFTNKGGMVELLAEEVETEGSAGRVSYHFTVRDTGIGMPEEFVSKIFEPFSRSGNAAHIEGTGLGLSITKGLIDLMGGKISVESWINEGSVFRVELEFDRAQAENSSYIKNAEPSFSLSSGKRAFSGCCFLVAEDNAINAEILCELLGLCGAETVLMTMELRR